MFLVVPVHKVGHENDQLGCQGPKEHCGRSARDLRAGHLCLSLGSFSPCILVRHVSLDMVDTVSYLSWKLSNQTSLKIFKEKSHPKPHCPLLLQLAGQSRYRVPFHSAAQSLCWKRRTQICWKCRLLKFIEEFTCAHLWQSSWCPWWQTQAPAGWQAQHSPKIVIIWEVVCLNRGQSEIEVNITAFTSSLLIVSTAGCPPPTAGAAGARPPAPVFWREVSCL